MAKRNEPQAVSWALWRNMVEVQLWEAVALVCGIEPRALRHSPHGWMGGPESGPFFEERSFPSDQARHSFDDAMLLAKRATGFQGKPIMPRGGLEVGRGVGRVMVALVDVVRYFEGCSWPDIPVPLLELLEPPRKPATASTRRMEQRSRLEPRTPEWPDAPSDWMGVTLERAANLASERTGKTWTVDDFLEAAADGRIRIRAVLPQRPIRTRPCDDGAQPLSEPIPPQMQWYLPIAACRALQAVGRAAWRTIEGFERDADGVGFYFDRWELESGEPDIVTTLADVLVPLFDVRALVEWRDQAAEAHAKGALLQADGGTAGGAQTPEERQNERLALFLEFGGCPPTTRGGRWRGVTAFAKAQGISRQAMTEELVAALARKKEAERAGAALDPSSLGHR